MSTGMYNVDSNVQKEQYHDIMQVISVTQFK